MNLVKETISPFVLSELLDMTQHNRLQEFEVRMETLSPTDIQIQQILLAAIDSRRYDFFSRTTATFKVVLTVNPLKKH